MKSKKLSRYFYKHPKVLFNGTFIFSAVLHAAMLIQIPFLKWTSLPAQKAEMTIINVRLENVKVHSKTNIVKQKEEKSKEEKKELVKKIVKRDEVVPYLKKEEKKKEPKKEKIEEVKLVPPPPSISKDITIKAKEAYEDKILKKINAMKYYPMQARRRGQEAVVRVEFTLNKDGTLRGDVVTLKKYRYKVLNEAAVKTIVMANPYPAFPGEIKKDEMAFIVDVDFRLAVW